MKKEPLFISFYSQSGSIGKTSVTALVASWLHYTGLANVLVCDCDMEHKTLFNMQQNEKLTAEKNSHYLSEMMINFTKRNRKAYKILPSLPQTALTVIEEYINKIDNTIDIVLFDFPSGNKDGISDLISKLNHLFILVDTDYIDLQVATATTLQLQEYYINKNNNRLQSAHLLWQPQKESEKLLIEQVYNRILDKGQIKYLQNMLSFRINDQLQMKDGKENIFFSTLLPPDTTIAEELEFDKLMQEVCNVINLHYE